MESERPQPAISQQTTDPLQGSVQLPAHTLSLPADMAAWVRSARRDPLAVWRLRLQAEQLRLASGFDRLICLDDIFIDQYPYQLDAALKALRDMRGRALLADEVGLGKTIEAGIIMKELIERGLARSILILVPASLVWQWQEEMELKFAERFEVLTRREQIDGHPADTPVRWLCSLERGKGQSWSEKLLAREYDLLIVDEAHKLKNRGTHAYRFVNRIRKRYVLLLTATPVHNNLTELYSLITILRPGYLGTPGEFKRNFIYGGTRRRVLMWSTKALGLEYLWRQYRKWLVRTRWTQQGLSQAEIENLSLPTQPTHARRVDRYFHVIEGDIAAGQQALAELHTLLSQGYRTAGSLVVHNPKTQIVHGFRIELELAETDKTVPRNPASLRQLLSEVMVRNRRSHVGVQLPRRQAEVFYLDLAPPERGLYDGVTAFVRGQIQRQGQAGPLAMALMTLQREVCSSPAAVARTLHKMVRSTDEQTTQAQLAELAKLALSIEENCKVQALMQILDRFPGRLLVFTDYRATMEALQKRLDEAGIATTVFHGSLSASEKERAVHAFANRGFVRQQARVMISTESGAEGRNLQFCHQIVNYDLPWNPMRIEQRIGRVHRLGQTEEVLVFNLAGRDTVEAQILDLLARKIRMFELVVGELDLILGAMDSEKSFETLLRDAFVSSATDQELAARIAELERMIDAARQTFTAIQSRSDALSDLLAVREDAWAWGLDEGE